MYITTQLWSTTLSATYFGYYYLFICSPLPSLVSNSLSFILHTQSNSAVITIISSFSLLSSKLVGNKQIALNYRDYIGA